MKRLKQTENADRAMNIVMEVVNQGTLIAFMVVLFYQAGSITSLPLSWAFFSSTVGKQCSSGPPVVDPALQSTYYALAVASAVLLCINAVVRLTLALIPIFRRLSTIDTPREKINIVIGVLVSIVDPWNGALIIEAYLDPLGSDWTPYDMLVSELRIDVLLLIFNNVPQLIIQIIYAAASGNISDTSVSWFVTIFVGGLHGLGQLIEIISLMRQLPQSRNMKPEMKEVANKV